MNNWLKQANLSSRDKRRAWYSLVTAVFAALLEVTLSKKLRACASRAIMITFSSSQLVLLSPSQSLKLGPWMMPKEDLWRESQDWTLWSLSSIHSIFTKIVWVGLLFKRYYTFPLHTPLIIQIMLLIFNGKVWSFSPPSIFKYLCILIEKATI